MVEASWAVGTMEGGEFRVAFNRSWKYGNYLIFTEEHKAWEFINTIVKEENRTQYVVRPVNIIAALKSGTYVEV